MTGAHRSLRRWARRTLNLFDLAFGMALALPVRLIAPVYRIEIQRIWAERIGHLAIEPELLLSSREVTPLQRTSTFFFASEPIANPFLVGMWRRRLRFGPAWLLGPIFRAGLRLPWLGLGAKGWDELHFDLRAFDTTEPHLDFTAQERERGRRLLEALGLDPDLPFVCVAVRDSAYLTATTPSKDWSYHDYRDSDIRSYAAMAQALAEDGYQVLRMGSIVKEGLEITDPRIVDYARSPLRSDFGDVFLFAHCAFCISTSTGMDSLAMAFRRPLGIVNLTSSGGMQLGNGLRLVMFKDFYDAESGERLSLTDPRWAAALAVYRTADFEQLRIRITDNSEHELVAFAREMVASVAGSLMIPAGQAESELAFLNSIAPDAGLGRATFHVSPSWLDARIAKS